MNDNECILTLTNGNTLRVPAFPDECDYVRVCLPDGREVVRWVVDEWAEDPELVMGAIFGAAKTATPEDLVADAVGEDQS